MPLEEEGAIDGAQQALQRWWGELTLAQRTYTLGFLGGVLVVLPRPFIFLAAGMQGQAERFFTMLLVSTEELLVASTVLQSGFKMMD